jgi:hypothetical protein
MNLTYRLEQRWVKPGAAYDLQTYRFLGKIISARAVFRFPGCKAFLYSTLRSSAERDTSMPIPAVPEGYAPAYKLMDRAAIVMAREPYRTVLAIARWWEWHRYCLEELGIRLGLLRSPIEADYYENYRFDPPDLWGTPLRRHEEHLA